MVIVNSSVLTGNTSSESFYIDSRASVPSKSDLQGYVEFGHPPEIDAANNSKIYAYRSGHML